MSNNWEPTRLDEEILRDGAVAMYHDSNILEKDIENLESFNYKIIDTNVSDWTPQTLHSNLKDILNFPEYYGKNLDAFSDCLNDMYDKRYTGLVITFRHFDNLIEQDKSESQSLLDIIARISRQWMISGQRLICLIQSDDPNLEIDKIGGYHPSWNGAEWFDDKRKT